LARIDYTAGSSAAAAVTALASAGSTFRDEYATTVAKMVEIDTNARKLKLSDLTTKVDTLKKEQERLDTQLAVDTAGANFDLVLKQRQLAAEAATLQAQTALDTAVATAEQRKAIEEMKLEIELVKRELELLKAKQELAAGKSGG
jgi:ribosomal protein L29